MLSGLLTSYAIIGRLKKNQPARIVQEYVTRFSRIVPPLAALVLFCTFILPELGSGPLWNIVIGHNAALCKVNWWRNFLFIHNYFGFENMVRNTCDNHYHIRQSLMIFSRHSLILYLLLNMIVLDSHTSSRYWYATVYPLAHSDYDSVEMAAGWFDWVDCIGHIQHWCPILCHGCPSALELCLLWSIVSLLNPEHLPLFISLLAISQHKTIIQDGWFDVQYSTASGDHLHLRHFRWLRDANV